MRIAHFIHRYPPALGGAEAYFGRLSKYLVECGDQVHVYTTAALDLEAFWSSSGRTMRSSKSHDSKLLISRYPLRHFPGQRLWMKLLSLLPDPQLQCRMLPCNPVSPQLEKDSLDAPEFDIVHATAFPYTRPILAALRLARIQEIPFLLTPFLHLGDPSDPDDETRAAYTAPPMRFLLDAADRIFVQTKVEQRAVIDLGIDSDKTILLGMGVNPDECTGGSRQKARRRWDIRPEEIVIGHLANNSEEKGTIDLLEAVAKLDGGSSCRVLLAGPEMPNFSRYWNRIPKPQNVQRLGELTDRQRKDFYAAIDIFALPSRSDSFGLVLLEAWANGLPCVGYRAGGIAEVIHHKEDGLLATCGDVAALVKSLKYLIGNRGIREKLGETGRRRVLQNHAWEPILKRVRTVYQSFLM